MYDVDFKDSLFLVCKVASVQFYKYNDCTITKVNNTNEIINIDIYPNPTQDFLTVNLDNDYTGSIIFVKNYLGKTLIEHKINSSSEIINLQSLSNGLYFLVINSNGKNILHRRVIKD